MKDGNTNKKGLRSKILTSHLIVAAIGVVILISSAMSLFYLRYLSNRLAEERMPAIESINQIESGLYQSLAAIRGWVLIKDEKFLKDREQAWQSNMYSGLKNLRQALGENITGGERKKLGELAKLFADLDEWQWHIGDVAQTPGNEPAKVELSKYARPIFGNILTAINGMIQIEKSRPSRFESTKKIWLLTDIRDALISVEISLTKYVNSGARIEYESYRSQIDLINKKLNQVSDIRNKLTLQQNDLLEVANNKLRSVRPIAKNIFDKRSSDKWNVSSQFLKEEAVPRGRKISEITNELSAVIKSTTQKDRSNIEQISVLIPFIMLGLFLLLTSVAYFVSSRSANKFTASINDLTIAAQKLAQGALHEDLKITEDNELGVMAQSFNEMRQILDTRASKLEAQNRLKTNLAGLSETMSGQLDLSVLAENILGYLCPLLDIHIATLFVADDDEKTLSMIGAYAYLNRRNTPIKYDFGEGLVGQAALKKESIFINNAPDDYLIIESSLGKTQPLNILIMPVLYQGIIVGIFEFGVLHLISDADQECLNLAVQKIGIGMNIVKNTEKTKNLLEKTQQLSEELQTQQEELKTSNEELEEQSMALKSSEEELKAQSEELQQSNKELEGKNEFLKQQKDEIEKQNSAIELSRQALMVKAEELEVSSKYKSEFLANMSHELRTPLNSLLILSKSLANNREGNLTEDQVKSATTVHSGGQELLELINDILDLSKVEAGKLSVHIETIVMDELKQDLVSKFRPVTEDKGLELNFETNSGVPETIQTDNQRAQQILKNLLSNAIKFTRHGSVTIKLHQPASEIRFTHSALTRNNAIGISVIDTGVGISEDKQLAIFEAFQQADGSTSREYGGTGLGLTISRELARLLGGEIQLQSDEGVGSTFTLYLPLDGQKALNNPQLAVGKPLSTVDRQPSIAVSPSTVSPAEAESLFLADDRKSIGPKDKSLLIIEDDRAFAQLLLKLARDKDYKCLSAGDGSSGLYLAQKYHPNGIILDLGLPDIDGLAVLDHLKHELATRHIPVHIMSGRDERSVSLQAGALDFLKKPVTEESIDTSLDKIEKMMNSGIKHLLVVEDDDTNREAIVKLIKNKQIKITDVADGQSALDLLKSEQFDCIILDLDLPDMTGFDILQKLEKAKDIHLPPVIIHTGRELTEEQYKELSHYADSIIIKGAASPERLLDEASLFLHSVTSTMPKKQQDLIQMIHQPDQALSGKRILLVDDDVRNTYALSKELREHGMEVVMADNGQFALDRLDEYEDVNLVLMDIMMPVMDGHEAMQKIRQQAKYKDLPIIALTALAMAEDRSKCIDSGANDYLSKPVDMDKLLSMMRIWLFSSSEQERRGVGRPWGNKDDNDQSNDEQSTVDKQS